MAFNKTRSIDAAQKLLNQGKLPQAIAEYQEILRHEPRDQVTLMTVGDLYVRQGETFKALEYFERLAQIYARDGFLTKAIAIYKKIAKLAPEETRPLERLAELYVQQGIMSEARPLYLQLAESHMRANRHAQAVALLRKLLEAEPDNLRVHMRLADLYLALGQKKEAAATFLDCAEREFDRGDTQEAKKLADRALESDPTLTSAVLVKARAFIAAEDHVGAAELLQKLPNLDSGGDVTALLIEEHLRAGNPSRAAEIARAVFHKDPKKFALAARVASAFIDSRDADSALALLDSIREAMTEAGEQDALAKLLQAAADGMPGRFEAREWIVELYARLNDSFHLPPALQQLGEAAAEQGDFQRAMQAYGQLRERAPEDEKIARRLDEIRAQLGLEPLSAVSESQAEPPSEPASKKFVEPPLDEETQRFVSQSLTDVDLFSSYGLSNKAIALLEAILKRAPRHTVSLEKLLDLYLGAGDERRTAELASRLEQIYEQRGDANNAERFSQLRRRFQKAAGISDEDLAAASAPAAPVEFSVQAPAEAAVAEAHPAAAVHEVDLSDEWASLSEQIQSAIETPDAAVPAVDSVEPKIDMPSAPPEPPDLIDVEESPVQAEAPGAPAPVEVKMPPPPPESPEPEVVEVNLDSEESLEELTAELEGLGDLSGAEAASAPLPPAPRAIRVPPMPVARPAPPPVPSLPPAAMPTVAAPVAAGDSVSASDSLGPLSEVFNEFRAELGEMGKEDEDLETHYNLGTAYREMGLLEEAIGEFQKVAQASENGKPFRYAMQCCTLLGLAFMDKGQPQIAAIWYERALQTPGLDRESVLALRYDLGVAQERAGDADAAMKTFSQVYAVNIDYRDVADRITALGKRR